MGTAARIAAGDEGGRRKREGRELRGCLGEAAMAAAATTSCIRGGSGVRRVDTGQRDGGDRIGIVHSRRVVDGGKRDDGGTGHEGGGSG